MAWRKHRNDNRKRKIKFGSVLLVVLMLLTISALCSFKFREEVITEDQVIFVAGGKWPRGKSTELVDVVPGSSCQSTPDLQESRRGHSLNILDNRFIICGGWDTPKSCIWSSSPAGPWSHLSTTNRRRWWHSTVIAGGTLHLLGGGLYSEGVDTMETLVEGSWIQHKLPYSIGWGSCAVQTGHDSFVVTGGDNSRRVAYQRGPGDQWSELQKMKVGRSRHGCGLVTVDNKPNIIVAGGWQYGGALQSSELFDIGSGEWSKAGDLLMPRAYGRIVSVKTGAVHRLLMLGGEDNDRNLLNFIEEFSVNNRSWTIVSKQMKHARSSFGAVAIGKSFCKT